MKKFLSIFYLLLLFGFCLPTASICADAPKNDPVKISGSKSKKLSQIDESNTKSTNNIVQSSDIPGVPGLPVLLNIDDPLQGMNRAVFNFNDFVIVYGIQPISVVYNMILPQYIRERIGNVNDNIQMPRKLLSNLFRARWKPAEIEFYRFLINTTIAIAGIYDAALFFFALEPYDSTFSAMLADWNVGPGMILFVPIYGGITTTDIFGKVLDTAADPLFWVSMFLLPFPVGMGIRGGLTLNSVSLSIDDYMRLRESTKDTYRALRDYIYIRRMYDFWH
jgi:phospholipid-binding lipoprotein MlaA